MTIQTTSKTLTLPPALNALAVIAQSSHDLLLEVEKTKEVYVQHVKESQETIASQAEENQKLKAELASLKQMHARVLAAMRGAHAAEIASYVSAAKVDAGRIEALGRRVDQEGANVQRHRTMIAAFIDGKRSYNDLCEEARTLLH